MIIDLRERRKGDNGMNRAGRSGSERFSATSAGQIEAASRAIAATTMAALDSLQATATPTQLRALLILEQTGGCNNTELAERLAIFPSSASRITDRLTAAGWITRETAVRDRREIRLILTPAGQRAVAQFVDRRTDLIDAVLAGMTSAEQAALLIGLAAYAAASGRLGDRAER